MSAQTIHLWCFTDEGPRQVRASIHDGSVRDVAEEVMRKITSEGHAVRSVGGDYTGGEGAPRALHFEVTGVGILPMWHAFTRPGEQWPRLHLADPEVSRG